ncbi:hypothetical protein RA272_28075, partial [Pseudomonas syringae pv. tagetis]|uniref:hypothetical protein n=1 Tax=Pseudomonas syringae group genomosp. 7 TaxID=251699 RepID=UPI00376FC8B6
SPESMYLLWGRGFGVFGGLLGVVFWGFGGGGFWFGLVVCWCGVLLVVLLLFCGWVLFALWGVAWRASVVSIVVMRAFPIEEATT